MISSASRMLVNTGPGRILALHDPDERMPCPQVAEVVPVCVGHLSQYTLDCRLRV